MTRFRLADLIAPQSVEEFFKTTYGQTWAHWENEDSQFRGLADWTTLNELLATQRFDSTRFRVIQEGGTTPVDCYTKPIGRSENEPYRRIVLDSFLGEMRKGATLSIDRVEQAHPPIRELAAAIEAELRAPVFVNMFASLAPVPGFDVHWDEQDALVIQLDGRKHWRIFEPTRQWPLYHDIAEAPKPEGPPVVELDIAPGDVLYVPHGWWHSANAIDEPSLHITIGIEPHNGIDFVLWLADQTRADEVFRRRLPRFAESDERETYLAAIRKRWNELMTADDILDQFLAYADGTGQTLPTFQLPDILDSNNVLDRKESELVLLAPRATITTVVNGFVLTALGRRWSFPLMARPLIDAILSLDSPTVGQVIATSQNVSEEQAAEVIFTLLRAGVIALQQ